MNKTHEVIQPSAWDAASDRCYCTCGHYDFPHYQQERLVTPHDTRVPPPE